MEYITEMPLTYLLNKLRPSEGKGCYFGCRSFFFYVGNCVMNDLEKFSENLPPFDER